MRRGLVVGGAVAFSVAGELVYATFADWRVCVCGCVVASV